jgi:hypothetical protein
MIIEDGLSSISIMSTPSKSSPSVESPPLKIRHNGNNKKIGPIKKPRDADNGSRTTR